MNNKDSVNVITLRGRFVSAPKLNTTKAGVPVTSFAIAVNRRNGKKSDYFTIVCWNENAEYVCNKYIEDAEIVIDGEMQTHRHPDKHGNNVTWYEVVADRVMLFRDNRYIAPSNAPVIPEQNGIAEL